MAPRNAGSARRAPGRDLRAWSLFVALTVPFAIFAHLAFDLVEAGMSWDVLLRPAHLLLLGLLVTAAAFAGYGAGVGLPAAERRRRLALRATIQADRRPLLGLAVAAIAQAMIVCGTVSVEESAQHPQRLVLAMVAGALAVLFGTLAIRVAARRILELARSPRPRRAARPAPPSVRVRAIRSGRPFGLFRPNRAPPLLSVPI